MEIKPSRATPPPTFPIGWMVDWESQAGGQARDKQGIIMYVIPAGVSLNLYDLQRTTWKISNPGKPRNHESYIVGIPHPGKGMEYFWPRTHGLKSSKTYFPVRLAKKNKNLDHFIPSKK